MSRYTYRYSREATETVSWCCAWCRKRFPSRGTHEFDWVYCSNECAKAYGEKVLGQVSVLGYPVRPFEKRCLAYGSLPGHLLMLLLEEGFPSGKSE